MSDLIDTIPSSSLPASSTNMPVSTETITLFLYALAPISLSLVSHFLTALYLVCVGMMSYWTARRVKLATCAFRPLEEVVPSFSLDAKPLARRHSYITPQGAVLDLSSAPSSPVLRRSLSGASATSSRGARDDFDDNASDSGSESGEPLTFDARRKSSSSFTAFAKTMRLPGENGRKGSLENLALSNRLQTTYWLGDSDEKLSPLPLDLSTGYNGVGKAISTYPLETPDINSPTDLEFPLLGSKELPLKSAADMINRQRATARQILCTLAAARVLVDLPVVYMEAKVYVTAYRWPSFFVSAFDLVILDLFIAFLFAIAPLVCFAHHTTFELPKSFEHHAYYSSTILLVLPLFATVQLPSTQAIQLYRMIAPIISAITLLIARDQATMEYWQPMEMKDRSRWSA